MTLTNRILLRDNPYRGAVIATGSMLLGYWAWFFVRSHISQSNGLLIQQGYFTYDQYSLINVIGFGTQLIAKFSSGVIVDVCDAPKRIFIITLLLAIILTVVNTFWDSPAGFIVVASAIKYLCAFGRVGILKIVALWWPKRLMGQMGAVINICSSFGELSSRATVMGLVASLGFKRAWYTLAGITFFCLIPSFFAKERPVADPVEALENGSNDTIVALDEDPAVIKDTQVALVVPAQEGFLRRVLLPLLANPRFYPVVLMAFTTTAMREAIGGWSMHFFERVCMCDKVTAGFYTASLFATQIPSFIVGGYLLDHLPKKYKTLVPVVFLGTCVGLWTVFAILVQNGMRNIVASLAMFLLINFALSAPNSFVDGVYVVEMCGSGGAAFGAGTVGTLGYLGAMTIQFIFGSAAKTTEGWTKILWTLLAYTIIAFFGAIVYMLIDIRERRAAAILAKEQEMTAKLPLAEKSI